MRLKGDAEARQAARRNRRQMSPAELALWRVLRRDPGGLHFRKQHPAGQYDLDFYCARANLAIEVDGAFHDRGDRPVRDAVRDEWLAKEGVLTLRVPAKEVFRNLDGVLTYIIAQAESRLPSAPPPR